VLDAYNQLVILCRVTQPSASKVLTPSAETSSLSPPSWRTAPTLYTYKVNQVLRVIDGDTMVVSIDLGFNLTLTQTIRVKGINAPEARTTNLEEKARGLAAKAFAEAWLQGKSLLIKTTKDDKYGRMLGDFICTETGTTFAEAMLVANHAGVYG
jgi:endonuclease YncB( thermonuclease family)